MSDNGVLSPTGTCKTFDAKADGYGRAEAVNVLYIKALQDAIRDKNPIRAIIRATTTNSDGKTPSITTPGSKSQEVLVRRAYEKAGIEDIGQTGFFECHGTGTVAGDTVETSAVAKLFKGKGVVIGAPMAWPEGRSYRVSVNSFGIGGANGHVILDSSSSFHGKVTSPPEGSLDENSRLLVVSAGSAESLQKRIEQIIEHANSNPSILHDLAYTLGSRREHLSHRAFTVAQQNGPISSSNFQSAVDVTPELVWVFTGQGAQWAGMGRDLIRAFPIASDCIRQLKKTLQQLPDGPSWLLQEELSKEGRGSRVNAAEFSQPLCTALQIALIDVLHSWGIRPSSVVGHSSGEIAAAYAAGAITAQSAIIIAYYRGLAAKRQDGTGAMAAVGLSAEDVQPYLQDGVVIACHNSPCSVTLSGDPPAMDTVVNRIKSEFPDVLCRRLKVSIAYHSHHMHELGQNYEASIAPYIQVTDQMLPLYSSVRAACITQPSELNATYWRSNLQSPVLFVDAVRGVLAASSPVGRAFLEIGPHSALSAPLRQTFHSEGAKPKFVYISTLIRNAGETRDQLLNTAGSLHVNGVSVNLQEINGEGLTLSNLPLYPWQHTTRYLQESRLTRKWRFRVHPHHELLGDRVVESSDWEPSWRNILRLKDVPWIEEHILQGNIIFPATGYIAMIGEAISQLDTSQDGYSIRDLIIKTPLLLRDSDEVEILTTLKQARISDITDSEWYTFSIMSHDSTDDSWIKHCHGRVRAGVEHAPKFREIKPYARSVDVNRCYRRFERFGFAYGNVFRGLRSISIHPTEHRASGTVADMGDKRSRHTLHPATMDSHLQMFNVLTERDQDASMGAIIPAAMGEVYVRGSAAQISFEGGLSKTSSGQSLGDIVGTAGDQILFSVSGLFGFPLSLPQNCKASQQLCSQIRWMPDIDMVPPNAMLRGDQGLERNQLWQDASRLCEVYIMETYDCLKDVTAVSDHLRRWQQWITTEAIRLRQQDNSAQPKSQVGDSMGSRQETISRIMLDHANRRGTHPILFECIGQIMENCDRIVLGQVSALDVLEIEGRLERYNEWLQSQCDWSYFLSLLGHSNPTIRVLEIGSGTGASTIAVLQHLRSPEGVRHYSQYTVTEAREASLKAVQKNLQHNEDLTYTLLDISVDPEAQGFDLHSYDLIIASNLHTAPRLGTALQHIRQLLAPNGRLLLHELCPGTLITEYLMGSLTQWSSAKDFRVNDKPYISRDRWDTELRNAGFIGIEGMAYDVAPPHQTYLTMLSRVPFSQPEAEKYSAVTLLTMGSPGPWANEVASCFREGGCVVNWTTLQDTPRENHWIISLLDLNGPYLNDFSEERYRSLQSFLLETDKSHMIWVTSSSQMDCADPRFGLILGLTRALRHEMPGSISLFETDCYTQQAAGALFKVFEKLQRVRRCSEAAVTESEYSFFQGVTHVSRCHWMHTAQISPRPETQCPRKLDVGSFGLIDTTQWVAIAGHREDLEKGQIEVDVHYVGLNFRDVLVGMGVFGRADELGLEGTGVVHRVASDVKDLQPGDRVMIIGGGLFRTRVVLSATFCRKIPADLALDDAATMGSVYMTAWYCLCHLGRLQNGDIFATVGNEDKAMYLIEEFGIPRNHIFSSRNSDFLPSLMEETQGRGVDIVLNSLSGKLLHTSWECVAPFGRFIEVGKRDFLANGQLAMAPFIENRSYIGFDLFQMGKQNPRAHERLLQQFQDWYDGGHIKPIRPVTIYEAAKVTDAFRYMQQGSHMGKILIRMPSDPMELAPTSQPPVSFSPNKSYLLVGGLGGVGRSVALWMVQRGARHLVILSRSAGQSDSDRDFILDLEEQGCHVICVAGSVATAADVESAIARCPRPLAGILQMSAVLRDQSFAKMTYDEWSTCLATKVRGTWNLHHAASDQLLDFFIVFSSIAGICGNHGQANYAAANTFLDSFTRYRRRLGLPSATLALGAVEDCGLVSRDAKVLQAMQAASVRLVREDELLEGVELAIRQSNAPFSPPHPAPTASPSTSIGQGITSDACIIGLGNTRSISDPTVRTVWPSADPRFSLYTNIEVKDGQRTTVGGAAFKELLRRVDQNPTMLNDSDVANNLSHELSKHLARHMPRAAEMSAEEVAEMPIDSLMAVEIQRGLRGDLNWDISMVEIAKIGKIGRLAEAAIQHLKKKYGLVREGE
ncbi:putative PKS/NRPS-like protein biosynthetic cluster [Aspergillus niger]|uniref:PKS/NRPS-like protein biosynthetic cluster n=1 Tax=Aspergillus niger TaxID=5061 RepID=A0A9W5ZT75_ASPNG|nr:putative PKS/NRPS-like protein biosynthetic cluster [Aspergillus niger]